MIDTAVARIQNTRPAAGIGGLAFSVFTIGLIHELNAASADIALLDDGTITCKDLKHGVFEIITKGDHPQRFVVDDPCVSINFQIVGSQIRVSEVANTPGQMALFHDAFLSTLNSFLRGQQDSLIQKWQHAENCNRPPGRQLDSAGDADRSCVTPAIRHDAHHCFGERFRGHDERVVVVARRSCEHTAERRMGFNHWNLANLRAAGTTVRRRCRYRTSLLITMAILQR